MREKAPAYQRYPKQIMGDDKVLLMDWDAYGMHNWLLDISWQQDPRGTIPDDPDALKRWLRNPPPDVWRRVWPQLEAAWPILGSGRRGNAGMIRCAEKLQNYSRGNSGKEKFVNGTQTGTQIEQDLPRKSHEKENEFVVSSKPPENLHPLEYARGILERLGIPVIRHNSEVVGAAVRARAKGDPSAYPAAVEYIIAAALDDRDEGIEINTFWFSDAKYNRRKGRGPIDREPGRVTACAKCPWCQGPEPCSKADCAQKTTALRAKHAHA